MDSGRCGNIYLNAAVDYGLSSTPIREVTPNHNSHRQLCYQWIHFLRTHIPVDSLISHIVANHSGQPLRVGYFALVAVSQPKKR